jgi:hypothetical protein
VQLVELSGVCSSHGNVQAGGVFMYLDGVQVGELFLMCAQADLIDGQYALSSSDGGMLTISVLMSVCYSIALVLSLLSMVFK